MHLSVTDTRTHQFSLSAIHFWKNYHKTKRQKQKTSRSLLPCVNTVNLSASFDGKQCPHSSVSQSSASATMPIDVADRDGGNGVGGGCRRRAMNVHNERVTDRPTDSITSLTAHRQTVYRYRWWRLSLQTIRTDRLRAAFVLVFAGLRQCSLAAVHSCNKLAKLGCILRCFIHRWSAPVHQNILIRILWCTGALHRWIKQRRVSEWLSSFMSSMLAQSVQNAKVEDCFRRTSI